VRRSAALSLVKASAAAKPAARKAAAKRSS
jgi:hypothetical protein